MIKPLQIKTNYMFTKSFWKTIFYDMSVKYIQTFFCKYLETSVE